MSDIAPPTVAELMTDLVALLEVTQVGDDRYEGSRKKGGVGRVFGGQVIAQALASAEHTVAAGRAPHSLHAYFLRGGSEDFPIEFHVDRQLDGGSFSNRRVVASQQGRPILNLAASFHKREDGFAHQDFMPQVPGPDAFENVQALLVRFRDEIAPARRSRHGQPSALELRPVEGRQWLSLERGEARSHTWFRTIGALGNDLRLHRAVLAYASDTLLGTCTRPHPFAFDPARYMIASLDHAVWFHDEFRADEWLLYAVDSPWSGGARGFTRGRIFTHDGRLVADVAQEGLIRKIG